MGSIREIVFDCEAAPTLARFWAEMLDGYAVRPYDQAEIDRLAKLGLTPETDPTVLVDGPGPILCFQQVPGRRYENNRVHLDIAVADRQQEVQRITNARRRGHPRNARIYGHARPRRQSVLHRRTLEPTHRERPAISVCRVLDNGHCILTSFTSPPRPASFQP